MSTAYGRRIHAPQPSPRTADTVIRSEMHRRLDGPAETRFWPRVEVVGDCWLWRGALHRGYGSFRGDGRSLKAYRWAWESVNGPVPAGLELDHLCRNKACVRPDHLDPVPHSVNVARGDAGGYIRRRTHCKYGHPFAGDNLILRPTGGRDCLECRRRRTRENCRKLRARTT